MKYFKLQDSPDLKYAPQLANWYGKFDARKIRLDKYPELPDQELFLIKSANKLIFTDIILFPFLLVSPMVMDVIKMYRDQCHLVNQKTKQLCKVLTIFISNKGILQKK